MNIPTKPQVEASPVAFLIDLISNALDPGYAEAARQAPRPTRGRRRLVERVIVAIGCVLTGFTLAVAYVSTNQSAPQTAKVHADLVTRARAAQTGADALQKSARDLTAKVDTLRDEALGGAGSLRNQLQTVQVAAGAVAVVGPGLIVTLSNPPTPTGTTAAGRPGTTPITASRVLTDRDVRSVANQLWAIGAEAISINDVRLTPTSAIRFAGQAVLVDFEPINPPYVLRAIGDADRLDTGFATSAVASRYQTRASVNGIGFSFNQRDKLELPASTQHSLNYARPVGAGSAASSSRPVTPSTGATK